MCLAQYYGKRLKRMNIRYNAFCGAAVNISVGISGTTSAVAAAEPAE